MKMSKYKFSREIDFEYQPVVSFITVHCLHYHDVTRTSSFISHCSILPTGYSFTTCHVLNSIVFFDKNEQIQQASTIIIEY